MSKTVLIVEKDLALMKSMGDALKGKGFEVEQTTDGKGAPELIRRNKPSLVVLAVDLDAGQNGYILCKKLKSDDDLKAVPIVIVGDPKGFGQHQKLKTRAEDYVGKPLDVDSLVDRVGGIIGFPELEEPPAVEEFDPGSILEEDAPATAAEEIALESATGEETVGSVDPDFEMVDSMFEDNKGEASAPPPFEEEISFSTGSGVEELPEEPAEKTVIGFMPTAPASAPKKEAKTTAAPAHAPFQSSPSTMMDPAEARELRAKVTELTATIDDSRARIAELENKIRELESDVETKQTELETARSSSGKGDSKEVFALRDAANKKDKEILRLKSELNAKEQEIVELRDKENSLEQQASDSSGELARRDAQVKTLQAKADQLAAERKKVDQQLLQAKEEGRSASAKLSTLQTDYDATVARVTELEGASESLRSQLSEAESGRQQAESDLSEARGEIEALRSQLDERSREADDMRTQLEQAQIDLDSARTQLTSQATTFADEISGLRQRLADQEAETRKHEERASRHQSRVRAQQEQLERVKSSLQQALDTIAESPSEAEDLDIDELAEA